MVTRTFYKIKILVAKIHIVDAANLENSNHKATTKKAFELWRFYFVYEEERFNIRNESNKFCAKVDILRIVEDVKTQVLEVNYLFEK